MESDPIRFQISGSWPDISEKIFKKSALRIEFILLSTDINDSLLTEIGSYPNRNVKKAQYGCRRNQKAPFEQRGYLHFRAARHFRI